MSGNPEEMTKDIASSSHLEELKTEAHDIGLIKKEVDEEELENNEGKIEKDRSQENHEESSPKVGTDVKIAKMSNETEELLIEYKCKNPDIVKARLEGDSDVKEVSNSVDVVAKSRFIRHDSVEIKEEIISDEDIQQVMLNKSKVDKRQHDTEEEASLGVVETKKKKTRNHNIEKRRQGGGEYHRLCAELSRNEERYYNYFHMSHESFEELHDKISPNITKIFSNYRTPITSRERLVVCLRYLASGVSYGILAKSFHLGRSTVSQIVRETCKEIWNLLRLEYMPEPTRKIWEECERGFSDIFNFPNCVGCIDGKHVSIKHPHPNNHDNYNKKQSSIVLLAVIDPWCKFTAIDIGDYGFPKDTGIFEKTEFYHTYIEGLGKVVPRKTLPGTTSIAPRVFIGDESFVLQPFLLRPYPSSATRVDEKKRKFNERLQEPRAVVKDTFDMFTKNWKIFTRPLETDLDTAINVIRAACCLHNYVIKQGLVEDESEALPEGSEPKRKGRKKKPKKTFIAHKPSNRRWTFQAGRIREMFVSYFDQ